MFGRIILSRFCAWRLITFRRGAGTVGGDLAHATAVAAQRHQAGDDGCLAVADAAHHHGALTLGTFRGFQRVLQLLEQPVAADKHRVGGDAGNFEEQRLEHDVHWFVGGETGCGRKGKEKRWRNELDFLLRGSEGVGICSLWSITTLTWFQKPCSLKNSPQGQLVCDTSEPLSPPDVNDISTQVRFLI